MENVNNQSEAQLEIVAENTKQQATNAAKKVEKVKSFRDYAYEQAGLNKGESFSLKVFLQWIKEGHIVDESYNENEHNQLKKQIENRILTKSEEKNSVFCEKNTLLEVSKPAIQTKIKELQTEVEQTKIDLENKSLQTGYQPEKYYMFVGLTIVLSLYLLLFYASTVYAAFFRNASTLMATAGDDITLYLDSIFDVNGIFTWSPALIFAYLGAFFFFGVGIIPHTFEGKNKKRNIIITIIMSFIIDAILAYKIDLGIHNLKEMAGIADANWTFYTSINFYLVMVFGFVAYLVWGYLFEMMLKEKNKKSGVYKANLILERLKEEINTLKEELKILEAKVIELEGKILNLIAQLEQLNKDLENRVLSPELLAQNVTSFYMGWRQYLNGISNSETEKNNCETTFNNFMQKQFEEKTILN
ncbi:hypothetical protein [Flavobacterium branchiophilum]|uniref:hypothetical protein n=1 Tax=Flavobacterium branchiophilum TaxID=55197 RepID=UPI001CBDB37D|nr:hypothetical protein [Flavobacterium branchiophilum]